jgi:geranylgeranyl reductase family protein
MRVSNPTIFDALVVGAGPAGSTTAYRLAQGGASVLLVDRARFPRDKPCGGAVTGRALRLLPFPIDPVVESVPDRFELRLRDERRGAQRLGGPFVWITQRRLLDAYLVEQAVAAGVRFEDGTRVGDVAATEDGAVVELAGRSVRCRALVVADGANGTTARALGLAAPKLRNVALEGNAPYESVPAELDRRGFTIEIGAVSGGYAWVVPKREHVNFGVGGWEREGPFLRDHLRRLCESFGTSIDDLTDLRGHRLPMGGLHQGRLARGRALAVGDAAGLVDPFSGDGMYEAFLSGSLAARTTLDLLAGRARDLAPYDRSVRSHLAGGFDVSWLAKLALDRFPGLAYAVLRSGAGRQLAERALRGDEPSPAAERLVRAGTALFRRIAGDATLARAA